MQRNRAGLYIDLDNMLGYCYSLTYPFKPDVLIKQVEKSGSVLAVARAYGSISDAISHLDRFLSEEEILQALDEACIVYVPSQGKKNTADLNLSLDAMEEMNKFDTLWIVSSDADFQPLTEKANNFGKEVVRVKMFNNEGEANKVIYYPDLFGLKLDPGEDSKVLLYRNILESVLKMSIPSYAKVRSVLDLARQEFTSGVSLTELASSIPSRDAFKILKTVIFGRGFYSLPDNKYVLMSIKEPNEKLNLESAFYRQCYFILKKNVKEVEERPFNRAMLIPKDYQHYSVLDRNLLSNNLAY